MIILLLYVMLYMVVIWLLSFISIVMITFSDYDYDDGQEEHENKHNHGAMKLKWQNIDMIIRITIICQESLSIS